MSLGCASYHPLPLARDARPRTELAQLEHAGTLGDTLSVDDLVLLALDNNPALVAARSQRGIARAQVLEAGIAPNPSLSANYGFLLGGPGTLAAIGGGLTEDLRGLATLSYRKTVANQAALSIDADLLWQEWQTIARARQLGVDLIEEERRRQLLEVAVQRLADLKERSNAASQRGDATLNSLLPDLGAEAAAVQQLADLERQLATGRRDLDALLGLDPGAVVPLNDALGLPAIDADGVARSLDTLPDRRPDLIALQFGYQSQEAKVRLAILSQFPLLSVGVSGGHDNSDVQFVGPQMTVELPVFNRNQGNIAIERAGRRQLHDEFTARLLAARTEVLGLLADQRLLREQLAAKRLRRTTYADIAQRSAQAYAAGDLDERTYLDAFTTRDTNELEILTLEQTALQQQNAIATLAGIGMPPVTLPKPAGAT